MAAIVLSLLSLLQIIDYLFKVLNLKDRSSGMVKDKVFAAAYARGIKKREKITHIPLSL